MVELRKPSKEIIANKPFLHRFLMARQELPVETWGGIGIGKFGFEPTTPEEKIQALKLEILKKSPTSTYFRRLKLESLNEYGPDSILLFLPDGFSDRQKTTVINALLKAGISSIHQLVDTTEGIPGIKRLDSIVRQMQEKGKVTLQEREVSS